MIVFEPATNADVCSVLSKCLRGTYFAYVEKSEHSWFFGFANGTKVRAFDDWRVLANGQIALAAKDDGQKFGHPVPIEVGSLALKLLGQSPIDNVIIRDVTADLVITVHSGSVLEIFNMSSGYEGWWAGIEGLEVVAQGGGQLSISRTGDAEKAI